LSWMVLDQLLSPLSVDVGIDLGTSNTPVLVRGKGIRFREPSYAAIDISKGRVLAVGNEAKLMLGRTPRTVRIVRPVRDGVIADFDIAEELMRYLLDRLNEHGIFRPRVMVGVPSDVSEVEARAVSEAARRAGARVVYLIDQPLAAAIGAGLPVLEPRGNMVLDIGGGTTEVSIVSLGGTVLSRASRVAGDEMDEAIINYVRRVQNLLIGERSAEELKLELGCAMNPDPGVVAQIRGRDLTSGLPRSLQISQEEICEALGDIVSGIADVVKGALEVAPPELASDIAAHGLVMTGGGSLVKNLDAYLSQQTRIDCHLAEDPLSCVALGTERIFTNPLLMRAIFHDGARRWAIC